MILLMHSNCLTVLHKPVSHQFTHDFLCTTEWPRGVCQWQRLTQASKYSRQQWTYFSHDRSSHLGISGTFSQFSNLRQAMVLINKIANNATGKKDVFTTEATLRMRSSWWENGFVLQWLQAGLKKIEHQIGCPRHDLRGQLGVELRKIKNRIGGPHCGLVSILLLEGWSPIPTAHWEILGIPHVTSLAWPWGQTPAACNLHTRCHLLWEWNMSVNSIGAKCITLSHIYKPQRASSQLQCALAPSKPESHLSNL